MAVVPVGVVQVGAWGRGWQRLVVVGAASATVTLVACGGSGPSPTATTTSSRSATTTSTAPTIEANRIAGMFDVGGGRQLYLECDGVGSPTVILEAGDEDGAAEWSKVEPAVAQTTRTCAYDRPGNGRSVVSTGCREIGDFLADLEALLAAAHVGGPYVLVGASGGGFLMAGFAERHPEEVAGIVLVETPKAITIFPPGLAEQISCGAPTNFEHRDYAAIEHAAWAGRKKIGDIPMTVISLDWGPGAPDGDEKTNVEDQRGWFVLSPLAKQVVVTSGHDVPNNEPDLVIREIRRVLSGPGN